MNIKTNTKCNYKSQKNKQNGITLIALVITIIVLLILAGVTLNMVVGQNGIFSKANSANKETKYKTAYEEVRLKVLETQTEMKGQATLKDVVDKLKEDEQYTYIVKFAPTAMLDTSGEVNSDYAGNEEVLGKLTSAEAIYVTHNKYEFKINKDLTVEEGKVPVIPETQKYKVTYNANGGEGEIPGEIEKEENENVEVSFEKKPTKAEYDFIGWSTESNTQEATYKEGGTTTLKMGKENITLYAVWKEKLKTPVVGVGTKAAVNSTITGKDYSYKNPVIPQGFKAIDQGLAIWTYSDTDRTKVTGWNEGLVIQDSIGNEFVWVPVDGRNVTYSKWCTIGESYSGCSDDAAAIPIIEDTQITTYGGFYVARYEAGLTTATTSQSATTNNITTQIPVSKKEKKVWNHIDYNNANTVAKAMINNSTTYGNNKSGLVTGKQWDTIMKWYQNSGIKVDTTQDWGTYYNLGYTIQTGLWFNRDSTTSIWNTSTLNITHTKNSGRYFHASGLNSNGIKKNIADIGGNFWEWTAEVYSSKRVLRSGGANDGYIDYPASYRIYNSLITTSYDTSFRCTLYIQ